jgi:cytidylate kinase
VKKDIKIAISGKSGCGNTTVSQMVANALKLRFINFTFRSLARDRALDLETVLELAANDDSWDREVDSPQVMLANADGGCVLGSRLAIWMLENADLKVYLKASPPVRARRIVKREGGAIEEVAAFTEERDKQDHGRYLHLYNIDTDDYSFVDLVVDTDSLTPQEIVDRIVEKARIIK